MHIASGGPVGGKLRSSDSRSRSHSRESRFLGTDSALQPERRWTL